MRPMRSVSVRPLFAIGLLVCAAAAPAQAGDKAPDAPPLPSPRVSLSLVTPTPTGTWTAVIQNDDQVPVRVVADATHLRLLVRRSDKDRYVQCELPVEMRGSSTSRQIVLQPGERYEERFEPALFCWGKLQESLMPGASVTAFLGWEPDKRLERLHKPQHEPFELEPAQGPATVSSEKQIVSLTSWLPAPNGEGRAEPAAAKTEPVPLGVPRFELLAQHFEDADSFRSASVDLTIKNVGDRAGTIHLRPGAVELRVAGPYGTTAVCAPPSGTHAVARDFFQTIAQGKSSSVQLLVDETCPHATFDRPGLYTIRATLHATQNGHEYGLDAVTGDFTAAEPVLLRVRQSTLPYHKHPPRALGPQTQ